MDFEPTGDRVFIEVEEESDTTPSGLVLPGESGKEVLRYGKVVAVSDGHWENGYFVKPVFAVGDRVFWARGNGSVLKIDDVEYLCMNNNQIAGRITG